MDTEKLIERLRDDTVPRAGGGNLPKAQVVMSIERREAADALEASTRRVKELEEERAFLLERAVNTGRCSFGGDRFTGMSSNALVSVAFGGEDDTLPYDGSDLAACYRTVLMMPPHLRSKNVFDQLERGERNDIGEDGIAWARERTEWPGRATLSQEGL